MDRDIQSEKDLEDLAKDLVNASLKGIIQIENKRGTLPGRSNAEKELFKDTLINAMTYLSKCGIDPYKNEKESE